MLTCLMYLNGGVANESLRGYLWNTHRGAREFFFFLFNDAAAQSSSGLVNTQMIANGALRKP